MHSDDIEMVERLLSQLAHAYREAAARSPRNAGYRENWQPRRQPHASTQDEPGVMSPAAKARMESMVRSAFPGHLEPESNATARLQGAETAEDDSVFPASFIQGVRSKHSKLLAEALVENAAFQTAERARYRKLEKELAETRNALSSAQKAVAAYEEKIGTLQEQAAKQTDVIASTEQNTRQLQESQEKIMKLLVTVGRRQARSADYLEDMADEILLHAKNSERSSDSIRRVMENLETNLAARLEITEAHAEEAVRSIKCLGDQFEIATSEELDEIEKDRKLLIRSLSMRDVDIANLRSELEALNRSKHELIVEYDNMRRMAKQLRARIAGFEPEASGQAPDSAGKISKA